MVRYTGNTGRIVPKSGQTPLSKVRQHDPLAKRVNKRAHALVKEVWTVERWKSSIASKIGPYIFTLAEGTKQQPPAGIPKGVLQIVHRCFAQACLELEAEGLNGQRTNWYDDAEVEAREHMAKGPS
jgi:hypothetical protein